MTVHKKSVFFETEAGEAVIAELKEMAKDVAFATGATYTANTNTYPDNSITFVEKHIEYLRSHPNTDPQHYMSNLRLMTRLK